MGTPCGITLAYRRACSTTRISNPPVRHPGFCISFPDSALLLLTIKSPTLSSRLPDFSSFHRESALFIYTVTFMPHKAKRPCKYPGCPNLTDRDYCAEHISQARYEYNHYRRDPETQKRYGSQWRKIRALYVKAHPLCEECLRHGRTTPVQEVHHIIPLADGGTHDFSNLMSLCKSCHSAITIAETNRKR